MKEKQTLYYRTELLISDVPWRDDHVALLHSGVVYQDTKYYSELLPTLSQENLLALLDHHEKVANLIVSEYRKRLLQQAGQSNESTKKAVPES